MKRIISIFQILEWVALGLVFYVGSLLAHSGDWTTAVIFLSVALARAVHKAYSNRADLREIWSIASHDRHFLKTVCLVIGSTAIFFVLPFGFWTIGILVIWVIAKRLFQSKLKVTIAPESNYETGSRGDMEYGSMEWLRRERLYKPLSPHYIFPDDHKSTFDE